MLKRFAVLFAPALLALTTANGGAAEKTDTIPVNIATSAGTITVNLDAGHAPLTTANFLRYVDQRRFDGTAFYRSMHLEWGTPPNGLIQGGTQNDPKRILKPVAHEPTSQTGVLHKRGTISMARFAPGTATGDFSIMLADQPGLDANPDSTDPEARAGFAAFGQVVSGIEVVEAIWGSPRSATKGVGVMKGQMLEPAVKIISIRRAPAPLPTSANVPAASAD